MNSYPKYKLVTTLKELREQLSLTNDVIGFDTETTGLDASTADVRLAQLCNNDIMIIVDCFKLRGGFKALAKLLKGRTLAVFYAGFEQQWFNKTGMTNITLWDVGHMRRSVVGGGPLSLKMQAKFDLDIEMSKEQQASNWAAKVLTEEQLNYAFLDAVITWQLYVHWIFKMDDGQVAAFGAFNDMTPAIMEMAANGIKLDVEQHGELTKIWFQQRLVAEARLRKVITPEDVNNLNSDAQWSDYFSKGLPDHFLDGWPRTEKTGQLSMKNDNLKHMATHVPGTPLAELFYDMVEYKYLGKYLSSFGESLINTAERSKDGRIRARFNVGAARTGRMSSSGPNVQQIPRDNKIFSVRQSFIAGPRRVLCSYDYSGIEMRVLALLSGDEDLLYDCTYDDVHARVASPIAGFEVTKTSHPELRQAAKAVNFGIIYGSGAGGLAATTRQSRRAAQKMIDAWIRRYPKAYNIRYQWEKEARSTGYLTTQLGGTIWVGKKASLPVCANYPVQRAAAEVMYKACARHKASLDRLRLKKTYNTVKLLATIHDCLIDECSRSVAPRVLRVMKDDMTAGFLDVFPDANTDNLVEGGSGPSWGDLS